MQIPGAAATTACDSHRTVMNHLAGVALQGGTGKGKKTKAAITAAPSSSAIPDASCGYEWLDKVIRSCKDPVEAASRARKGSLKNFGVIELKLSKAKSACLDALGKTHEELAVVFDTPSLEALTDATHTIFGRFD